MICSPSGEWKVTGSREKCVCNAGFEPNEAGTDCERKFRFWLLPQNLYNDRKINLEKNKNFIGIFPYVKLTWCQNFKCIEKQNA